jgi:signal transduction histidine kinase
VKSVLLAVKITTVFLLVMGAFVVVTLHLFMSKVVRPLTHGHIHPGEAHDEFVLAVLLVGFVAMCLMIAFSLYITSPLRRMSHSMDRIAAGDLEHRIPVRGRDEVAAMGHSFNTMAERVRSMVVGQKELMAGVSHELRSPLTRMKVSLELLRQDKEGAKRIADLEGDVDTLDDLVEELLLASRFDLGSVPLELEALDLPEVCRRAWERVAHEAEARGSTLKVHCTDDAQQIHADRALVLRLLGNLFENAVRYAGGGEVTVGSIRRGDRVQVTVADSGPGVDEADLAKLFEPFFRTDPSRSRKTGAGGLGLMIVRRAVEAHAGRVRAGLGKSCGLEVSFDLPAGPTGEFG